MASESEELRQLGNVLYKQGKLYEAIKHYRDAAKADESDPAPLSNLSAALFETGHYEKCVQQVEKASELANAKGQVDPASANKLKIRKVKALIMLDRLPEVLEAIAPDEPNAELKTLADAVKKALLSNPGISNREKVRKEKLEKIVKDLPRFKSVLLTNQEYYHIGHDEQQSNFKPIDAKQEKTAYLFAATVIARALIIFLLLEELSDTSNMSTDQREEILGTLFYVYINHIMPPKAWQKLQSTISQAIELLGQPIATFTWFDILQKDRNAIRNALVLWQHQTAKDWPTSEFRKRMLLDTMKQMMNPYATDDKIPTPKGCKKDAVLYQKACIVTPPPSFLQDDPLNLKEVMASKNFPKNITDVLLNKIDNTWMPNVTLIDTGHLKQFLMTSGSKVMAEIDLSTNIIDQWSGYLWSKPANPTCLYDYAVDYFTKVSAALHHLKGRIRIEPILGEMDEIFEKIHLDFYPDRLNKPVLGQEESGMPVSTTEDYPKIFDRVHLSNVPDYTGGTLGAFLFAAPITPVTKDFKAQFSFTCLRNPPAFKDVDEFNSEYCLLPEMSMIAKIFLCVRRPCISESMPLPAFMQMQGLIGMGYFEWSKQAEIVPFPSLLDRPTMTAWIHGLLLKTAIPKERQVPAMTLINSPFNLTVLFRVIMHLKKVGYPSHWLSEIKGTIIGGTIDTKAFPQKSVPFSVKDSEQLFDKSRPLKRFSIKPFNAELTTLTSIWLPALGFGLLQGNDVLPDHSSIRKYSVTFNHVNWDMGFESSFILVFIDMDIATPTGPRPIIPLRLLLLNKEDQLKNALQRPRDVREKGLHIVTTWQFETETKTGRFWMREDIMKRVMDRRNGWHACIWRVDRWDIVGQPVKAATGGVKDLGISWAD
ncbi:hypothetical protein D6D18_00230 [Aureobasidium pullulans]|nr:hypothetical protein D6D18_00230 [Aureobasidium pullulans]